MASTTNRAVYAVADEAPARAYIIPGKPYAAIDSIDARSFGIRAENGRDILCLWTGCAHLYGLDWRRVTSTGAAA
jgi:hypothetical protein